MAVSIHHMTVAFSTPTISAIRCMKLLNFAKLVNARALNACPRVRGYVSIESFRLLRTCLDDAECDSIWDPCITNHLVDQLRCTEIFMSMVHNMLNTLPHLSRPRSKDAHDHSTKEDTPHHESQTTVILRLRLKDKVSGQKLNKTVIDKDTSTDGVKHTGNKLLFLKDPTTVISSPHSQAYCHADRCCDAIPDDTCPSIFCVVLVSGVWYCTLIWSYGRSAFRDCIFDVGCVDVQAVLISHIFLSGDVDSEDAHTGKEHDGWCPGVKRPVSSHADTAIGADVFYTFFSQMYEGGRNDDPTAKVSSEQIHMSRYAELGHLLAQIRKCYSQCRHNKHDEHCGDTGGKTLCDRTPRAACIIVVRCHSIFVTSRPRATKSRQHSQKPNAKLIWIRFDTNCWLPTSKNRDLFVVVGYTSQNLISLLSEARVFV
ncbi:zinc-regulated transporter 1, partial [Aureobasidium melanogenum]